MRNVVGIAVLVFAAIVVFDLVNDNAMTLQGCAALATTWGGNQ